MSEGCFSDNYQTARARFLRSAARAGGRLDSLELTAKGPSGEALAIDMAWFGARRPRRVFVHSSGLHGVEAFAGSAIQLQWLDRGITDLSPDAAVALVHVLNPYGMAWLRRVNEHNVDLNRNFLASGDAYGGAPRGYGRLDSLLNPQSPPSWDLFYPRAAWLILRHGMRGLKQTVAGGQYANPRGLFFGGASLEEGPRLFQRYVQEHLDGVERLVVVDVHTGLGPFGVDTLLVGTADEGEGLFLQMKKAFGPGVSSMDPARGPAYRVRGAYDTMYQRLLPTARTFFVAQEFGTYHAVRVIQALRAENRWHLYGGGGLEHPTKRALKETFGPKSRSWREAVLRRGNIVIGQALALMTAPSAPGTQTGEL